jgi:hypothetical protein
MAQAPPNPPPDDEEFIEAAEDETDEPPTEEAVEFDFSAADTPPPRPRQAVSKPKGSLKEVAVPLLFTIGVILLIPAIWGTLMLMGKLESTRDGDKGMAAAMLVCYPVSACLIAGGIFFLRQVLKEKARRGASVISKE